MSELNEVNEIELKVKVSKKLYYDTDKLWGCFALCPLTNKESVNLNNWGNFTVNGSMTELFIDQEYDIVIRPNFSPKYGKGYEMVGVKPKPLNTSDEQFAYLEVMLKPNLYEAIKEVYDGQMVIDLFKSGEFNWQPVKGMGQKVYDKTRDFLLQHLDLQSAFMELQGLGLTFKSMKKLSDHFGSPTNAVQKVKESVFNILEVNGFGFIKVDQYFRKNDGSVTDPHRINAAIYYILEQKEQDGHCWISKNQLLEESIKLLQIDKHYIEDILDKESRNPKTKLYQTKDIIALYKNYYHELKIRDYLIELMQSKSKIHIIDVDAKIDALEDEGGFKYSHEQREAIKMIIDNNVCIIDGKGGTGKSFLLQGALKILSRYSHVGCALSGKATRILAEKNLNAMTIHRLLKYDPKNGGFTYNRTNRLDYQIIILDEASMVNSSLMYSLISALPDGCKFVIQGDYVQLAAISAGSPFYDLLMSGVFPRTELLTVHRQASMSGVLSTANTIRDGIQINGSESYDKKVFGELKDMVLFPVKNKEYIRDLVLDICEKSFKNKSIMDFQVITPLRSRGQLSVKELNIELQKMFNDMSKPFIKRGNYEYRKGDKCIQNGNNYEASLVSSDEWDEEMGMTQVFNGTLGIIERVNIPKHDKDKGSVWIQFDGVNGLVEYKGEELDNIELAYAISVHRSQGSTIPYILFAFDFGSYMLLSKNLIYTGISRASKGCVMICENSALRKAVSIDHSGNRNTFLPSLLEEVK